MKQTLVNILFFSAIILQFSSCIETEVSPWNTKPIHVVFSVISPGKNVKVFLSDYDVTSDNNKPANNANIYISNDNSNWIKLERSEYDSLIFIDKQSNIVVEAGETYYLKVETTDKTILAQTSVPLKNSIITEVSCFKQSVDSFSQTILYTLQVKYILSSDKQTGSYLEVFGNKIGNNPELTGNLYQDNYFLVPFDSVNFDIKMITMDSNFKKYKISENINTHQYYERIDFNTIISNYGGVRPTFSNIENGIGLFGSFITSSFNVNTQLADK